MSYRSINKKIAEALGLAPFENRNRLGKPSPNGDYLWYKSCEGGGAYCWTPIPDFYHDLNAMHKVEMSLLKDDLYHYHNELHDLTDEDCMDMGSVHQPEAGMYPELVSAKASQRAEAFLKFRNLWEEKDEQVS